MQIPGEQGTLITSNKKRKVVFVSAVSHIDDVPDLDDKIKQIIFYDNFKFSLQILIPISLRQIFFLVDPESKIGFSTICGQQDPEATTTQVVGWVWCC